MRVLFLHSASDLYGSGRILLELAIALKSAGHECIVVLPAQGPLEKELHSRGFQTVLMNLGILRRQHLSMGGVFSRVGLILGSSVRLLWLVRKLQVDLIFSNTLAVLEGAVVAFVSRRPHLWHVLEIIDEPKLLSKGLAWMLSHFADVVIMASRAVERHWSSGNKMIRSKSHTVHYGIRVEESDDLDKNAARNHFGFESAVVIVGMVGRIHFWKGQGYFLSIARNIHDIYPETRFCVVGDVFPGYEYLYRDLLDQVETLGLAHVVQFLGYRSDVTSFMKAIDILVVPSIRPDPLPTVVLEGMGAGLPIVGTNHGGIPEMIVDGVTGVLIPWDDPVAASERISALIRDSRLREEYGAAGRERVMKEFSREKFAKELLTHIRGIGEQRS